MKLSDNFSLDEFTRSASATVKGIDNTPSQEALENLSILVKEVLQPVRSHFGLPVSVSSGYRSPELNTAIGGSTRSQHCKGQAADIEIPGVDNRELAIWIQDNCPFDQLILEFYNDGVINSGWVHVSHSIDNREQLLLAEKNGKRTIYKEVSSF